MSNFSPLEIVVNKEEYEEYKEKAACWDWFRKNTMTYFGTIHLAEDLQVGMDETIIQAIRRTIKENGNAGK